MLATQIPVVSEAGRMWQASKCQPLRISGEGFGCSQEAAGFGGFYS